MHIAMFCHNYPPHVGGLEVMVRSLAAGLGRTHRVTLLTTAWNDRTGISDEDGVQVVRLPAMHQSERWGIPYPVPTGRSVSDALALVSGADLLHAHGALYPTTLLAVTAARRGSAPLVITEHVGFVRYRSRAVNAVQHAAWSCIGDRTLKRAAAVAVYNRRVEAWLTRRLPELSIEYIRNGVDATAFRPRTGSERRALREAWGMPADEPVVLFVGRAVAKKNLGALLALRREKYVLATCGAPSGPPMDRVLQLGVIDHARMPDVFAAVDLLVLPSTGEGFPLAAQEGMAAGLPVVILWDEGYVDAVAKEVICACRSMEEVRTAVDDLVESAVRRRAIGEIGREWAMSNWSWEATTCAYQDLYLYATNGDS